MKVSQCEYCGDDLGYTEDKYPGDPMVVCNKRECNREARYDAEARQADARERAEQDGYSLYGGSGW